MPEWYVLYGDTNVSYASSKTIETPDFMFGRNVNAVSFLLSLGVTFVFTLIVKLVLFCKLKKSKRSTP